MIEKLDKMIEELEAAKVQAEKLFDKGIKASAAKIRKSMQEIKTLAQEVRVDAQAKKTELSEK